MNNQELITLSKEEFYLLKSLYDNKQCPLKNYTMDKRLWFTNKSKNNSLEYLTFCPNCLFNNYDKLNLNIDDFKPILSNNYRFNCDFSTSQNQIEKSVEIDNDILFLSAFTNNNGYLQILKKSNNNDNDNDNDNNNNNNNNDNNNDNDISNNIDQYDIYPKSDENIILCLYNSFFLDKSLYIKIYNIKDKKNESYYNFLDAKKSLNNELIVSLNNECLTFKDNPPIINKFKPNNKYILEYRNILNDFNSSKKIIINIKNIN